MNEELWFVGPRRVEVRRSELRARDGEVVVRGLASGISQGTELLLYRGEGPAPFDPSVGASSAEAYPVRYGYAWVGTVVDSRGEPPPGTRVFALAPHATHHALTRDQLRVLDPDIPPVRAVLAANLEAAVTCVWDAEAGLGDEVVVLGAGVVGLLTTWLLSRSGARVRVVEPSELRREMARRLGAEEALEPSEDRPSGEADVVVEASGDPGALDRAIEHAGFEARVVVASFYGARRASIDLGSSFHRRRLLLRASQVSSIPPARARRWSAARRFGLVQRLLREPLLDGLITRVEPLSAAPAAYAELDRAPGASIQTVFRYEDPASKGR